MAVLSARQRTRRRGFAIVLACVLAYEAYAFFIKEAGEAENIASASDWHLTGEVAGEVALTQGLVPHADSLEGLDLWVHATSDTPQGPLLLTITENTFRGVETVMRASYAAADVVSTRPFHLAFARIDASAGHQYTIHLSAPQATRGHGVRFEASGPVYPQGSMTLGEREEWGDLQFRTIAERTTIYRNVRHLRQSAQVPAFVRSDLFLVLMLLLFNVALAVLLRDVVFIDIDEPSR